MLGSHVCSLSVQDEIQKQFSYEDILGWRILPHIENQITFKLQLIK